MTDGRIEDQTCRGTTYMSAGFIVSIASTGCGEYLVSSDGQRFLLDTPVGDASPSLSVILNWQPPR